MLVHQFYQSPAVFCPPPGAGGLPINSPGFPPTVVGPTEEDQTLTCLRGTWTGDEPIIYAYQWYRVTEEEPPPDGEVLTTDDGEPLTDDDGEELTT